MRCPYCGGINSDRASFCASCGRDLATPVRQAAGRQPSQPPPYQEPPNYQRPAPPTQARPAPNQRPPAAPQQQGRQGPTQPQAQVPRDAPAAPPAPAAPAPFPPRNLNELQTLAQGALAYTVAETTTNGTRKKIVRIVYPGCVAWQQVATLLKALQEQQEDRFESIVIEGYYSRDDPGSAFTNGQLSFDRNVRLGSQTLNRYLIETGNGYASDSVRIVLTE